MSDDRNQQEGRSRPTPPPLPRHSFQSQPNKPEQPWVPLLVLGGALAAGLLMFVQETRVFGESCYHIGDITLQTDCFPRELYMGAWVVAAGLIGFGLLQAIRK